MSKTYRGAASAVLTGLALFLCLPGSAAGTVLFADSFDDGDAVGWAPYDDSLFSWGGDAFSGTGGGGNGIYTAIHSADYADMSYGADVVRTGGAEGSFGGLAFRIRPDGSRYLFGVSRYRSFWFARVSGGTVSVLHDWTPHSVLDSVRNGLRASCSGGTIRLYANGRYLARIDDPAGPASGSVGLFVQHDAQFSFDNVLADDVPLTGESPVPFVDTFDDGVRNGWFTHGGDVFAEADGRLAGTGGGGGYLYRSYVSGAFTGFTAVTTVERTGGSRYFPAGLSLRGQEDSYHSGYLFAVNGNQEFMFSRTDGGVMTQISGWVTHSSILAAKNTLAVTCTGQDFELTVNGTAVGRYSDTAYASGAVGLFVSDDVSAVFDSLSVRAAGGAGVYGRIGSGFSVPLIAAAPNPGNGRMRFNGSGIGHALTIYSSDGRIVRRLLPDTGICRWDGMDAAGRTAPAGIYMGAGSGGSTVRIIRTSK